MSCDDDSAEGTMGTTDLRVCVAAMVLLLVVFVIECLDYVDHDHDDGHYDGSARDDDGHSHDHRCFHCLCHGTHHC